MKRPILVTVVWLAFLAGSAFLTACNTVEGAGEDVEAVGEGVSDASRDVRD